MRILFLTNKVPYPPKDGGAIATLGMVQAFANAGHSTTVLAMNTLKHHVLLEEIPPNLHQKINFHLVDVPAEIKLNELIFNFLFSKLPYNAARFLNIDFSRKLIELFNANEFDIVQLEGLYLCPYIDLIRRYSKAKVVLRSHNIEHEIWERTVAQSSGLKKIYLWNLSSKLKRFEISYINKYDLLVPITKRDQAKLNLLGNQKPTLTIPSGIDVDGLEPEKHQPSSNLFFIGALDWAPNQEGLIWFFGNCWNEIQNKCPNISLTVAGRNAPEWFEKILAKQKLNYVGEVPDAKTFMANHGIMVAPLLSGSGMRVKIVEAMSLKKPIVTTLVGCEGIDAENGSDIFIAATPEEFVEYTVRLVNDYNLQTLLSENSYKFVVQNYSNESLSTQLINFYKTSIQ